MILVFMLVSYNFQIQSANIYFNKKCTQKKKEKEKKANKKTTKKFEINHPGIKAFLENH